MTLIELKAALIEAINNHDGEEAYEDDDRALIEFLDAIDFEIGKLYAQVTK